MMETVWWIRTTLAYTAGILPEQPIKLEYYDLMIYDIDPNGWSMYSPYHFTIDMVVDCGLDAQQLLIIYYKLGPIITSMKT